MKKKEKRTKKRNVFLLILEVIMIITSCFCIYEILLLGPIEKMIRYLIIFILVLIDLIFIWKVRKKKKNQKKKLLIFFLLLYSVFNFIIGGCIMYVYGKIDKVNKTYVTYSSSLISMSKNDIKELKDVKNLTIGILSDKKNPEGYIIPQEIIKENHLKKDNTFKEYDDYNSMMADLYDDTIHAMFITSDYYGMFTNIETYQNIETDTHVIYQKEKKMAKRQTSQRETASTGKSITEPFTILLMGVDSTYEGLSKNTVANGDSLILITFNPKTLNATMISIPRDSYVPIACWSGMPENKITHAAAYGTDCMMNTIENYFDVTIDYYAKINFRGLVSLVDTLGGIDVDVPQDLCTDNSNREDIVCINQGRQHLNGEQALVLSRNRKQLANGDLDRGLNQQIVIQGIVNKVKDMSSINEVMGVLNTISNNLDTNFTTEQILSFYDIAKDIMVNALQKDDEDLINIEQLFLQGIGQMIYDERARIVLWDYIPNPSSREDIIKAMKINLGQQEPEMIKEFSFSIHEQYEKTVVGAGPYKKGFSYALLPDFTGDSMAQAQSWANRNGIRVTFHGSSGYVVSQSYPANKRVDLMSGAVVLTLSGNTSNNNGNNNSNNTNHNSSTNNKEEEKEEENEKTDQEEENTPSDEQQSEKTDEGDTGDHPDE